MSTIIEKINIIDTEKQNIKNAIKRKGVTTTNSLSSFAPAIDSIQTGGKIEDVKTINITENGTKSITASPGFDGMKGANITTNVKGETNAFEITLKINGVYNTNPSFDGWNKVNVETFTAPCDLELFKKIGWKKVYGYSPLKPGETTDQYFTRLKNDINVGVAKYNSWNPNVAESIYYFKGMNNLVYAPFIDLSKITGKIQFLFDGCNNVKYFPPYDFSKASDIYGLFANCETITEAPDFYFPTLKSMRGCFSMTDAAEGQTQKYSHINKVPLYDTENIIDMAWMFNHNDSLKTVPHFNTKNVTDMKGMFDDCTALTSVPLFNTSNVTNMNHMFDQCTALTSVPLFNTSKVTDMAFMFSECTNLKSVPSFDTQNVTDMRAMFDNCPAITSVPSFNTSKVTDMAFMFSHCNSLISSPELDTQNVTDMNAMFQIDPALTSVPLFNTSKVTDMSYMFSGCSSLKLIPAFDTQNVTDMSVMINGCTSISSIPNFNMSNVTNMEWFAGDSSIASFPALNTAKVTNFLGAFQGCKSLTKASEIDVSSATTIQQLFYLCSNLKEVRFKGGHKGINCSWAFTNIAANGKAYFKNDGGDYSDIIAALPSGWTHETYN